MTNRIQTLVLPNGVAILGESMPWLESAALSLIMPAGCVWDPPECLGLANFTCEMSERGAGSRNSREFLETLEFLGAQWSGSVSVAHTSFGAAVPHDRLFDVLPLFADLVRRPQLPQSQLEDARQSCLQEIHAIEDDLAHRALAALRERFFPTPWGRGTEGKIATIENVTYDHVREFFTQRYHAGGAIVSVAGKFDWDATVTKIEELWGDWSAHEQSSPPTADPEQGYHHLQHESAQTQIAIACPSVPYRDQNFYQSRGAIGVLSDGMSSRLFSEVREKRGLAYTVSASCHSLRDYGAVLCYAGTTPDRAQETLDVLLSELNRLNDGIEQQELDRLKARIKSMLIMQQESSRARSSQMAGSWYHLGRVQTLEEIGKIIDELSCDSINAYLQAQPLQDFTIVTLGPQPLEIPSGV